MGRWGNKSIVFISLIFFCTAIFGIIGFASIIQPFGFFENQNPFDIQKAEAAPPPAPPTNVQAQQLGNDIQITWTKEPTADGYNVYRYATNDTDFPVRGGRNSQLPSDYLHQGTKYSFPTDQRLGTATGVSSGDSIHATGINFTQIGNATLTAIFIDFQLFRLGTCINDGDTWISAVWNGSKNQLTNDYDILVNGSSVLDCDVSSETEFTFPDFELEDDEPYIVGAYRNGTLALQTSEFRRLGSIYGGTSFGDWVRDLSSNNKNFTKFSSFERPLTMFAEQFQKVATLGDVATYTDSNVDEGITYFYQLRSVTSGVEGGKSESVNATAALISGGDILNSTSTVWQFREEDDRFGFGFGVNYNFTIENSATGDSAVNMATIDSGFESFPNEQGMGGGSIFKVFPKSDIEGSDITIYWEDSKFGPSAGSPPVLTVRNGSMHKDSGISFPDTTTTEFNEVLGQVLGPSPNFAMQNATLSASSIDYENATDFVTVIIKQLESHVSATNTLRIANITITKIGFWDFQNPQFFYTTLKDPPPQGHIVNSGRCFRACVGPDGFHANRGFYNMTGGFTPAQVLPSAPTSLNATATSISTIDLEWNEPADGGSPITGYKIEQESPIGGGFITIVADTGTTATMFEDTGLESAIQYNYKVSAINAIGTGPASNEASATTFTPEEAVDEISVDLETIINANPGTPLADKLEDANALVENALVELNKMPPDNQAAMGSLEGAVGDIQAAVDAGDLDAVTGNDLMDQITEIARQIAEDAIDNAINTPGSDPVEIVDAQQFLADGDSLRTGSLFKDAVTKYKVALTKAESALP